MTEGYHCYNVPQDIKNFAALNFPAHLVQPVIDHWQGHGSLPRKIYDQGNVYYPRQLYACLMFKAAREAAATESV